MIAIRGINSNIAFSLCELLGNANIVEILRDALPPLNVDRYLFCQGILYGKRRADQTAEEISNTYKVNYTDIVLMCDYILEHNTKARICVIGSESGISGSYDDVYASSKQFLHSYVEKKRIGPYQQLVCVAPWIIVDAGMTLRRQDKEVLSKHERNHPKGRFITCHEVAQMIYFLLYIDKGYTTSTVIRMHGGGIK